MKRSFTVREIGGLGKSTTTSSEYHSNVSEELVTRHLEQIELLLHQSAGVECYVLGMGSHPKSTYKTLLSQDGIRVLWNRPLLRGWFRPLSWVIASYSGLVKIEDSKMLRPVVDVLSEMAMIGIYFVPSSLAAEFEQRTKSYPEPGDLDFGIKSDPNYGIVTFDFDNCESPTGIVETVSFGKESALGSVF